MITSNSSGQLLSPCGVGFARRTLDVVAAAVGLLLLAPVCAVLAALVWLSSPGPALFRQRRVGEGGDVFTMYKFRSMRSAPGGSDLSMHGDPRVTAVGRFLRRSRLDEIPQLFNVLRGDMTLVGPRPETVALARRYPSEYREVLRHRPGMTGPVQVHMRTLRIPDGVPPEAYYLTVLVPRRVALDLEYLQRPTLRRTIALLVQTAVLPLWKPSGSAI